MSEKGEILEVRNAVFRAADGKSFGATSQGVIMAWGKLAAQVSNGDDAAAKAILCEYFEMLMQAMPIYCTEIITGQDRPS